MKSDAEISRLYSDRETSLAEFARRLRMASTPIFLELREMLGDDLKAARAIREEAAFIKTHPDLPRGEEFAGKVRGWLVDNKLEWSQENLEKAVAICQPVTGCQ